MGRKPTISQARFPWNARNARNARNDRNIKLFHVELREPKLLLSADLLLCNRTGSTTAANGERFEKKCCSQDPQQVKAHTKHNVTPELLG